MANNNIKMAYLLLAHKNPEQVNMFIQQLLDYGDCDIYIHVDAKNKSMSDYINKNERVFVCSEYDVRWGSFEICKAAIKLMELAKASGKEYTHFYYGSCQDLLVKRGLYEYLNEHNDSIFLKVNRKITNKDRASARYRIKWSKRLMVRNDFHIYRFVRIIMQLLCKLGIVLCKNKKKLRNNVEFYEGRTWFIAPFNVLRYITDYIDKNQDYLSFWEDSLASDLMFFQTIILNSEFAGNVENELMYVNFGKTFGTSNHPITVTIDDYDKINEGNYFCARKFEISEPDTIAFYINKTLENSSEV